MTEPDRVARLVAWVHGEHAVRPTRGELRDWADAALAERDELHADQVAARAAYRSLLAQTRRTACERDRYQQMNDELRGELERARHEAELYRSEFDAAVDELEALLAERDDEAHAEADDAGTKYPRAELREPGVGRASCPHGATSPSVATLRLRLLSLAMVLTLVGLAGRRGGAG